MIFNQGYSHKNKQVARDRIDKLKEQNHQEIIVRKQKIRELSRQTNELRKKIKDKTQTLQDDEEERRATILENRKLKQKIATEKFQRIQDKRASKGKKTGVKNGLKNGKYHIGGHVIEIQNGVRVNSAKKDDTEKIPNQCNSYAPDTYLSNHMNQLIDQSCIENKNPIEKDDDFRLNSLSQSNPINLLNNHLLDQTNQTNHQFERSKPLNNHHIVNNQPTVSEVLTTIQHDNQLVQKQYDNLFSPQNISDTMDSDSEISCTDSLEDSVRERKMLKSSLRLSKDGLNDFQSRKVTFSDSIEFNDGNIGRLEIKPLERIPLYQRIKNTTLTTAEPDIVDDDVDDNDDNDDRVEVLYTPEEVLDQLREEALAPVTYPQSVSVALEKISNSKKVENDKVENGVVALNNYTTDLFKNCIDSLDMSQRDYDTVQNSHNPLEESSVDYITNNLVPMETNSKDLKTIQYVAEKCRNNYSNHRDSLLLNKNVDSMKTTTGYEVTMDTSKNSDPSTSTSQNNNTIQNHERTLRYDNINKSDKSHEMYMQVDSQSRDRKVTSQANHSESKRTVEQYEKTNSNPTNPVLFVHNYPNLPSKQKCYPPYTNDGRLIGSTCNGVLPKSNTCSSNLTNSNVCDASLSGVAMCGSRTTKNTMDNGTYSGRLSGNMYDGRMVKNDTCNMNMSNCRYSIKNRCECEIPVVGCCDTTNSICCSQLPSGAVCDHDLSVSTSCSARPPADTTSDDRTSPTSYYQDQYKMSDYNVSCSDAMTSVVSSTSTGYHTTFTSTSTTNETTANASNYRKDNSTDGERKDVSLSLSYINITTNTNSTNCNTNTDEIYREVERTLADITFAKRQKDLIKREANIYSSNNNNNNTNSNNSNRATGKDSSRENPLEHQMENLQMNEQLPTESKISNAIKDGSAIPIRVHPNSANSGNPVRRGRVIVSADHKKRKQVGNMMPRPPMKPKTGNLSNHKIAVPSKANKDNALVCMNNRVSKNEQTKCKPGENSNGSSGDINHANVESRRVNTPTTTTAIIHTNPIRRNCDYFSDQELNSPKPNPKPNQMDYNNNNINNTSRPPSVDQHKVNNHSRPSSTERHNNNNNKNNNSITKQTGDKHRRRNSSDNHLHTNSLPKSYVRSSPRTFPWTKQDAGSETNIPLNKTPTDDEINKLWTNVRQCIYTEQTERAYSDNNYIIDNRYRKQYRRTLSGSLINRKLNDGAVVPRIFTNLSPNQRYGSQDSLNHQIVTERFSPAMNKPALLPQRATRVIRHSNTTNENKYTVFKGNDNLSNGHRYSPDMQPQRGAEVTTSMASFLMLEELCKKQSLTPRQAEAVFQASNSIQKKFDKDKSGLSALSIEERCVMESLERLNSKLKEKGLSDGVDDNKVADKPPVPDQRRRLYSNQ